ncbi:TNT domain-containing protein [Aeromicrobium sp.]|uniref:TNT domain-containing protein n=1 Tax=Aeromicrobium sp. TaxID=1871063 RepID=UPI0019A7ECFA|nr:TNT domain-containing protein [Aeromicrobium sp.]MBC7633916.1 TNT domain-containing protein [Aeromicrobium sp.]
MTTQNTIDEGLAEAGLPAGAVVLTAEPTPDAPPPSEGPRLVTPFGSQAVVRGLARGTFAPYESLSSVEAAIELATRHAATTPEPRVIDAAELARAGTTTATAIRKRTASRGQAAGPNGLSPGDALDTFGPDTAHHLFAAGTPFPERSLPPSDIGQAFRQYTVQSVLPPHVMEGLAAPWFGQPGGGAMVVLDRPIRWYVDHGQLTEVSADPPSSPRSSAPA